MATAVLTSSVLGVSIISATGEGIGLYQQAPVTFTVGAVSPSASVLTTIRRPSRRMASARRP